MESISIKEYIINNFKDDNIDSLNNAIDVCIKENDEVTLPGMGVFMEIIWQNIDDNTKKSLLTTLEKGIKKRIKI